MPRFTVIALALLGVLAMSCDVFPTARPGLDRGVMVRIEPAPDTDRTLAIERMIGELDARHTALAEGELRAVAETIVDESLRHGLDPDLVMAVIRVESGGYHLAVSSVGALGLMQLLPDTAEELAHAEGLDWRGPDSLFDPVLNVKLGTAYLRLLSDRYDDVAVALAAYNWGPGRIDRRLRRGAVLPSRYIHKVMKHYSEAENAGPPAHRS